MRSRLDHLTSDRTTDSGSPWPWVIGGLAVASAGVGLALLLGRSGASVAAPAGGSAGPAAAPGGGFPAAQDQASQLLLQTLPSIQLPFEYLAFEKARNAEDRRQAERIVGSFRGSYLDSLPGIAIGGVKTTLKG